MGEGKNIPAIRFKGFGGEWESRRLDAITEVLDGDRGNNYPNGSELQKTGHTLFLNASNVTTKGFKFEANQYVTEEKSNSMGNGKLAVDDIILTSRGSIGHIAWYNEDIQQQVPCARINSGMLILRSKEIVVPCIIAQYLKSPLGKEQIDLISFGSAQPQLTKKGISNYTVILPSDQVEQTKIGNYFQQLDNLIALHQRKHDKLLNVKKAMLEKMFPKNGADVPEIRFKGFSEKWVEREVCKIFNVTRGNVLAATETSEKKTAKSPFPVYSSQTKNNGLMGYYEKYLFENAITWTTDGANAGTVNHREGKFYSTNVNGVLLSNEGYANKAIAEILNGIAWKHVSHVGNPKLMNNVMSKIRISIPRSMDEQKYISIFLNEIDTLLTLHQSQLDEAAIAEKRSVFI